MLGDSLFMHMVDGWMCGSAGYRDWADKELEVGVEMSLEMDELFLIFWVLTGRYSSVAEDSSLVGCRRIARPASSTFGMIVSPSSSRHFLITQRNISEDQNVQVPIRIYSGP